jgi:hypothetical protein
MTQRSKFSQRDVKAAIKGAHGAGVTVKAVKIDADGDIVVKLNVTPPTAAELDDEVATWNKLIEADK